MESESNIDVIPTFDQGHVVCIVPCKHQETTDFVTAKVIKKETEFKDNLEKDIKIDIDECIIEVEAKSEKGFHDVQHSNIDAKVLRIYPPQGGNVSVEATSNENGDSDDSIQRNKSIAKWKSVGSDICKLTCQISRRDCCKTSAIVIFRHLIMFQYYHKWKKFDKSIQSLWVPPDEEKLKKSYLEYHFLAEWDEKSGRGLIQDWKWDEEKENCPSCEDPRCGKTTKDGILCKYKFVKLFIIHECGENVDIQEEDLDCKEKDWERFEGNLQADEDKWGVMIRVVEEWEKIFEKLLDYYNTKDVRTICKSICLNEKNMTRNKVISLQELEKWIQPQIEPSLWIKILARVSTRWQIEYEKVKKKCITDHDNLLGRKASIFHKSTKCRSLHQKKSYEKVEKLSKIKFFRSIVRKLRNGDEQVIISLKSFCHRMERAELIRLWPPPLLMMGITLAQWIFYINHKIYYKKFLGTVHQSPICSVFVINPDRVWGEPWRFLTYGMIHNNFEHILINSFCQLFFGIPLEMTNESWRIAVVYISGIFLGGLLRETFSSHNNPLAGASGGVYALVACHLAQLVFNWHNDSFVLRQRVNFFHDEKSSKGEKHHKPPEAHPMPRLRKLFRLALTTLILIFILTQNWCGNGASELCDGYVSHTTHTFGFLTGLLSGPIFLRVRSFKRPFYILRITLFIMLYGFAFLWIFGRFYHFKMNDNCPWVEYERLCQQQCYSPDENHKNNTIFENYVATLNDTCKVSLCR